MTKTRQGQALVVFENSGVLDPRLITTLGVNVKESLNPIGFFGTGLKFAIATALRERQRVWIVSNGRTFHFYTVQETVRGKDFPFIYMKEAGKPGERLGFTAELGKTWELWQAYREFHCNALDEGSAGGRRVESEELAELCRDTSESTVVCVEGEAFAEVHDKRSEFILDWDSSRLAYATPECEAFHGPTKSVFYRGVRVARLAKPCCFTYNVLEWLPLTEDRTVDEYYLRAAIKRCIAATPAPEWFVKDILTREGSFEQAQDFTELPWGASHDKGFLAALAALATENCAALDDKQYRLWRATKGGDPDYERVELTGDQRDRLLTSIAVLKRAGFEVDAFPIVVVKSCGEGILARAENGKIWLGLEVFEAESLLRRALLEEWIHLAFRVRDYSIQMQGRLFEMVLGLVEKLDKQETGE